MGLKFGFSAAKKQPHRRKIDEAARYCFLEDARGYRLTGISYFPISLMAAWAADSRAMGTRKGLQET